MQLASWPCPAGGEELALSFDRGRRHRLLVLPALFDEASKLRHFTIATMRLLDAAGIDSLLPDLAGTNESLAPLECQTITGWREQAAAAAIHFRATHLLSLRAGALLDPGHLPGWRCAAASGPAILRGLLRARVLAEREAGREVTRENLLAAGRTSGLTLAGYQLGPAMIAGLDAAEPVASQTRDLPQSELGGPGLWLRAEPAHDPAQAARLAGIIAAQLA